MNNAHLTADHRKALADLFASCDTAEFLRCVSGLVQHRIDDLTVSLDAGEAIRRVANDVAKYERALCVIQHVGAGVWAVTQPGGTDLVYFGSLAAAKAANPGATVRG